jgi:methionyl-tRNA formyltransferase
MMKKLRIVFFGTPAFAIPSLRQLLEDGHAIQAVVTIPDKPAGRGMKPQPSPVKQFALENHLPVLTPENLLESAFLRHLQDLHSDLFVVVAFKKLPREVWAMPPMGTINLHASLLPAYRGAAPIHWVLINGDEKTGLTTFLINDRIDTGDILLQLSVKIESEWNAGDLHDVMKERGAYLLSATVWAIAHQTIKPLSQPLEGDFPKAPKIQSHHCQIQWEQPAQRIHNLVRGLSPSPGAETYWQGKRIKILKTRLLNADPWNGKESIPPGTILNWNGKMCVSTTDGFLQIERLKVEGKKEITGEEFLIGYRIQTISSFETTHRDHS